MLLLKIQRRISCSDTWKLISQLSNKFLKHFNSFLLLYKPVLLIFKFSLFFYRFFQNIIVQSIFFRLFIDWEIIVHTFLNWKSLSLSSLNFWFAFCRLNCLLNWFLWGRCLSTHSSKDCLFITIISSIGLNDNLALSAWLSTTLILFI